MITITTKSTGTRVTGLLALTMEAQSELAVGDPVMMTGDWECDLADGTAPAIGHVSVANVQRSTSATSTTYPAAKVPGDVTVEVRGFEVRTALTDDDVVCTAGAFAAWDGTDYRDWVESTADADNDSAGLRVGIFLTGAAGGGGGGADGTIPVDLLVL